MPGSVAVRLTTLFERGEPAAPILGAMPLVVEIPGRPRVELGYLLLDVNGTLSARGELLDGVSERLAALGADIEPWLLSADTFGTLAPIAERLAVPARPAATAGEKHAVLCELGAHRCAAIGNGVNDVLMLSAAALGIAVLGAEGASAAALAAADVVCSSVLDALDLLLDPRALAATLRA
jgi:soluble P-type ATPase